MGKVKDGVSIPVTFDGEQDHIHIKWYAGDENEGYGVEIDSDTTGIQDYALGDCKVESYLFSNMLYTHIAEYTEEHKDIPKFVQNAYLYLTDGEIKQKDIPALIKLFKKTSGVTVERFKELAEELRVSFGWEKEEPPAWLKVLEIVEAQEKAIERFLSPEVVEFPRPDIDKQG